MPVTLFKYAALLSLAETLCYTASCFRHQRLFCCVWCVFGGVHCISQPFCVAMGRQVDTFFKKWVMILNMQLGHLICKESNRENRKTWYMVFVSQCSLNNRAGAPRIKLHINILYSKVEFKFQIKVFIKLSDNWKKKHTF